MAYVAIQADESRMEEGPEGLEFKSFLGTDTRAAGARSPGVGNVDRGYTAQSSSANTGFWTIDYYAPYFDVDTKTVLHRCISTLLPGSSNYLSTHLTPAADLYGPFWCLNTLVFTLFLSSSLAQSISAYLSTMTPGSAEEYDYDFKLLGVGATIVYAYGMGLPLLLWLGLRYLGVGEWSPVEALAVWGYAQFVWIPVSILCVIPVAMLRWALVGVAFAISGWFLGANIYPILATAESKATRLFIVLIAVLHAAFALGLKIMFFSYYVVSNIGPGEPILGGGEVVANSTLAFLT